MKGVKAGKGPVRSCAGALIAHRQVYRKTLHAPRVRHRGGALPRDVHAGAYSEGWPEQIGGWVPWAASFWAPFPDHVPFENAVLRSCFFNMRRKFERSIPERRDASEMLPSTADMRVVR